MISSNYNIREPNPKGVKFTEVTLKDVDKLITKVAQKQSKLVIRNGFLQETEKRGFRIFKSQVGKSAVSKQCMEKVVKNLRDELNFIKGASRRIEKDRKYSRETIEMGIEQLETLDRILNSLHNSDWAKGVLNHNPELKEEIARYTAAGEQSLPAISSKLENGEQLSVKELLLLLKDKKEKPEWTHLTEAQLAITLCNPVEKKFRTNFLQTYRNYMTTTELFTKLKNRLAVHLELEKRIQHLIPNDKGEITFVLNGKSVTKQKDHLVQSIENAKKGVFSLCEQWISDYFINGGEHLKDGTIGELIKEISQLLGTKPIQETIDVKHINPHSFQSKHKSGDPKYKGYTNQLICLATRKLSKKKMQERQQLLETMADDLMKRDAHLFSQISSKEFVGAKWNNKEIGPNLTKFSSASTDLSNFVAFSIIAMAPGTGTAQLQKRKRLIEFFIDLAHLSLEKGNFSAAMAIFSGLNMSSVDRLKDSFSQIDRKHQEKLEIVAETFSPDKNNKNYKEKLHEVARKEGQLYVPIVSYLLTEITSLSEGADKKEGDKIATNFIEKFSKCMGVVAQAQKNIVKYSDAYVKREGKNFFETEFDISKEMDLANDYNNVKKIVDKVSDARETDELTAMKIDLNLGTKKFADIVYDQSLRIQPRKK